MLCVFVAVLPFCVFLTCSGLTLHHRPMDKFVTRATKFAQHVAVLVDLLDHVYFTVDRNKDLCMGRANLLIKEGCSHLSMSFASTKGGLVLPKLRGGYLLATGASFGEG